MTAQRLPNRVRVYIGFIFLTGAVSLGIALSGWSSPDLLKFGAFLAVTILSAGIQFNAPGVTSALSPSLLFAFFGVLELTGPETVVLSSTAAVIGCLWNQHRRPGLEQVAFNVAATALAATAATWLYQSPWLLAY